MGKCTPHFKLSVCKWSLGTESFSKFKRTVPLCKGRTLLILFHRVLFSEEKLLGSFASNHWWNTHTLSPEHVIPNLKKKKKQAFRLETMINEVRSSFSSLRLLLLWQRWHSTAGYPITSQHKMEISRVLEMFLRTLKSILPSTIWEPIYMFNSNHLYRLSPCHGLPASSRECTLPTLPRRDKETGSQRQQSAK